MNHSDDPSQTPARSLLLHLLPGLLTAICYFFLVPTVLRWGYPSIMALSLAVIMVMIPFEGGILVIHYFRHGQKFLGGVIRFRRPLSGSQYLLWTVVIVVLSGLLFSLFNFTSDHLMPLFGWIPEDWRIDMGLNDQYSRQKLIITYIVFFVLVVILGPVTEELYFRGYLLPRMPGRLKGWSVPVHSTLFALYHFWTPWLLIARTISVLPLVYIVRRKENVLLGIFAHVLVNSVDLVMAVIFISAMP